ncbi:MAG: PKD domain-containing protein [Ilumatobacteraceae bacterium]
MLAAVAALVIVGVAVGLVMSGFASAGAKSIREALTPGTAWFASPATGQASLIDGPTSTRVITVDAGAPGHDLEMVQAGDDGFVVDRTAATMRRIDSATFHVDQPVTIGASGDSLLRVEANQRAVWVISQGSTVVQQFEPETAAAIGGPLAFPGTIASSVITTDGTLWALDAGTGLLRSYRDDHIRSDDSVAVSAAASLVAVDDTPVIVDAANDTVRIIDPRSGRTERTACLEVPPGADLLTAGSVRRGNPWVIGVLPTIGTTQVVDIATGTCRPIPLSAPGDTPRYGPPVSHGDRVFVPDRVDGTVIVIEPRASTDPIVGRIQLGLAGHRIVLFEQHSYVWFDDLDSDTAGVIQEDLTVQLVAKTLGDGRPTPPPDAKGATPDDPAAPQPRCAATPDPAQPGQPVRLDATIVPATTTVTNWRWDLPGASPATATGPQIHASWTTTGTKTVRLTTTQLSATRTPTSPSTPATLTTTCTVVIADDPSSPTTTIPDLRPPPTPPPTTALVPATPPPPPSSAPATDPPLTVDDAPPVLPPTTAPPPPTGGAATTTAPPPTEAPVTAPPTTPAPTTAPPTTAPTTTAPATTAPPTSVVAAPAPDFDWTPATPKVGDIVHFHDRTTGSRDAVSWTFDGGSITTSTETDPLVTWTAAGTFDVTLTATKDHSAASINHLINIVTDPFVGTWLDVGTGHLDITRRTDDDLDVHVFGNCTPTACDSGIRLGTVAVDDSGFTLAYDDGVATRAVDATLVDNDTISAHWRSTYPPADIRGVKCWTTTYHKSGPGVTIDDPTCSTDNVVGNWLEAGTGRLAITRRVDGDLDVHVFGDCTPTACDSGTRTGTVDAGGTGLTMSYDDGVAHRDVDATFTDSDTLSTHWRSTYPPADSRGVLCWITTYHKSGPGATVADPTCAPDKFLGSWLEQGTGKFDIAARTDGNLDVHVLGDCSPTACDAGIQLGTLNAGGSGFRLAYNDGVADRVIQTSFVDGDTLSAQWRSTYPVGDSRGVRCWTTTYHRSGPGSTTTPVNC